MAGCLLEGMKCRVTQKNWIQPTKVDGIQVAGHWGEDIYQYGVFIDTGVDYTEFENGPGIYSTAIVLFEDGTIGNVRIDQVQILDEGEAPQVSKDDPEKDDGK